MEIRCEVGLELAGERYRTRASDERHLDAWRSEDELWGEEVRPLGVGPLITVATNEPVDVAALASRVTALVPEQR